MYNYGFPMNYQQPMTDIGHVSSEQEAVNAYVAAGRSKIMFTQDDLTIYVKCVGMNGQVTMDIFDRRVQAPEQAGPEYVTKEELKAALEALRPARKTAKEAEE